MKTILSLLALSFFLNSNHAVGAELPTLDSPIAFSKDEDARLQSGKAILKEVQNSPFKAYCDNAWIAVTLLKHDCQESAGLLMDFQRHPSIFPKLKDISVAPLGESRYRITSLVKAGFFQFHFTTLWAYDSEQFLATFRLDTEEQNDFEEYRGFWKFVPQPNEKSLVLYSIRTKTVGNPLAFLEDQESRKEMVKTLEEFQKAVAAEK